MADDTDNGWDPQTEDFQSDFNTYVSGPGANLGHRGKKDEPVKLYVTKLPNNISPEGLDSIFRAFGKPISVFLSPNKDFGFIEFKTASEGESAIRELDGKGPYNLRVSFARSKEEKDKIRKQREQMSANYGTIEKSNKAPAPQTSLLPTPQLSPVCGIGRGEFHTKYQKKVRNDERIPQQLNYNGDSAYYQATVSSNASVAMQQRKHDFRTEDACISKGRGYVHMEDVERYAGGGRSHSIQSDHFNLQQLVRSAVDVIYNERQKTGLCSVCRACTTIVCGGCEYVHYCSVECQRVGWGHHQFECGIIDPEEAHHAERQQVPIYRGLIGPSQQGYQRTQTGPGSVHSTQAQGKPDRWAKQASEESSGPPRSNNAGWGQSGRNTEEPPQRQAGSDKGSMSKFNFRNKEERGRGGGRQEHRPNRPADSRPGPHGRDNGERRDDAKPGMGYKGKPNERRVNNAENRTERETREAKAAPARGEAAPARTEAAPARGEAAASPAPVPREPAVTKPPMEPYQEVQCVYRESAECYWVVAKADMAKLESYTTALTNMKLEPVPPTMDLICAAQFEGMWCRGRVVATAPKPRVHYMDWGNTEDCHAVMRLEGAVAKEPPLASRVTFAEGATAKLTGTNLENEMLSVRKLRPAAGGGHVVHVKGEPEPPQAVAEAPHKPPRKAPSETSSEAPRDYHAPAILEQKAVTPTHTFRSVFDAFDETTGGLFQMSDRGPLSKDSAVPGAVAPYNMVKEFSTVFAIGKPTRPALQAKVGEAVVVADDSAAPDVLHRGVVKSVGDSTIRVELVDMAKVTSVEEVFPLEAALRGVCSHGGQVTLLEEVEPGFFQALQEGEGHFAFAVTGPCDARGQWPCRLLTTEDAPNAVKATGVIGPWAAPPELRSVQLAAGETVIVPTYVDARSLYLRPVSKEWDEKFVKLANEVAGCCLKAPALKAFPQTGEMVGALFTQDKCFYRAVIVSVVGDKARIIFVDYGNVEEAGVADLRALPEELKRCPCFAVKVELKDVPNAFSQEAALYLNHLTADNVELTLQLDGPLRSGVRLREVPTGIDVNGRIVELVTPKWKTAAPSDTPLSDGEVLMCKDQQFVHLKVGEHKVLVLFVDKDELTGKGQFYATDSTKDHLDYLTMTLGPMINEMCAATTYSAYQPRVGELCLAQFEGEWYRAVYISEESYNVHFIDYGNKSLVENTAIRKMTRELTQMPGLAVLCQLNGRQKLEDPAVKTAVLDAVSDGAVLQVAVTSIAGETYSVDIPQLSPFL